MYMKRFLGIFLSLIIVIGMLSSLPITVSAAGTSDLTFVLNDDGKTYSVTDCKESASGSLSIPSEYKGLPVTKIGDKAFASCEDITSITIPATVTSIGAEVFDYCKGLTSISVNSNNTKFTSVDGVLFNKGKTKLVQYPCGNTKTSYTIPSTVKYIGNNAFAWSTKLLKVVPNDSIISIGDYGFAYCGSLESITLPSTVTSIGRCAFYATYVNKITIPKGVTVLEDGTFSDCYKLSSVTLPEGITSIGEYCFMSCDDLTSITLPSTLKTIGNQAFDSCTGFTTINLPAGVTHIGDRAFDGCTGLTNIKIPNSVTYIGSNAFSGCKMTTFDIPNSVKFIGYGALGSCPNLTTVTIGSGLETIEAGAFSQSVKLTTINVSAENKNFSSVDGILFNKAKTEIVKYPMGKTSTTYSIPDSVVSIRDGAFAQCRNLTSMIIPDAVNNLGAGAFTNCANLSSIVLGSGIKSLNNGVFQNCKSLSTIDLPDGITSVDDFAFYGCTNLASINIKDDVNHIGRYAFMNTAYYNDKTNWKNNALYLGNCLIEVDTATSGEYEIKSGTKTIGEYALSYCDEITSLRLPDTMKNICDNAFYCCEKLESVLIPAGVVNIGTYAFFLCKGLKTVCYKGTKAQWDSIIIGEYNEPLSVCKVYYESDCFHIAGDWIIDTPATVYKAGSKHKECTKCGEKLETAKINQLKCSKPKLKTIENTEYGVKITWGKVKGGDSYRVYRKTSKSDWTCIATTSKSYYTDKTAKSGTKYYYAVKARNEEGNSSLSSSLSKLYLSDPTLKTPSSTKSGVKLTWSKVSGSEGYMVYRKTGTGSYSRIATVKGSTKVTYTDKSAKKGKKYTYRVKAYKSKTYSAYSNTKTITDKY